MWEPWGGVGAALLLVGVAPKSPQELPQEHPFCRVPGVRAGTVPRRMPGVAAEGDPVTTKQGGGNSPEKNLH